MILTRSFENQFGTFGKLVTDSGLDLHTLERPYLSNKRFVSCVPLGEYDLIPYPSSRFGETVKLSNSQLNVFTDEHDYGRYAILFHVANIVDELLGCIAVGTGLGCVKGKWAVTSSADAMEELREAFISDKKLIIR